MSKAWWSEFWRALWLAALALAAGAWFDRPWAAALVALLVYLAGHLFYLHKLERWLRMGAGGQPLHGYGVWADVFYHLYRLRRRHWRRKRTISNYLNRFRELTAAMPDATVVATAVGEIEWFNGAAGRLLGLHSPQDIGQRVDNLVRHPAFVEYLHGGDYEEPVVLPSPADERVMLSVVVVPFGRDQRLLVARDITRLHRLEQVRRDFVANVSHEMRTPLTVMAGYLETLSDDGAHCPSHWRRPLQLMSEQTDRMQHLVSDLLLLSRLETERLPVEGVRVDVPRLLDGLKGEALSLSGGRHQIQWDMDQDLHIRGRQEELRSAFSNLVTNAVRYTPAGGQISIRWYFREGKACFEVRDTGIGIAPQHLPRLTERFYRVDVARSRQTGGTGLGLAIVKHVLERHGSRLEVRSVSGRGSTFRCCFPPVAAVPGR
ncbi:MAG TPA: phosphate regulon sensor histidine kinase PhoR [Gammaproteobacteria bacterium]|nr:phosphate regulon sensor histidine kinase PhoR [Gammaproteobacteria bacterium]